MQPCPSCGEKKSLTDLLNHARLVYARAARDLERCGSNQFGEAYEIADNARFLFEIARDALDEHVKQHGC